LAGEACSPPHAPHSCMDDLTGDPVVEELASRGRHYKMCVVVITQHPQKLLPVVRSNADIVCIFRLHSNRALATLAEDYLPGLEKDQQIDILTTYPWKDKKTKKSQCLIVTSEGNTLSERLFTYSATEPPPFTLGCREYWTGGPDGCGCDAVPDEEELKRIDEALVNGESEIPEYEELKHRQGPNDTTALDEEEKARDVEAQLAADDGE